MRKPRIRYSAHYGYWMVWGIAEDKVLGYNTWEQAMTVALNTVRVSRMFEDRGPSIGWA